MDMTKEEYLTKNLYGYDLFEVRRNTTLLFHASVVTGVYDRRVVRVGVRDLSFRIPSCSKKRKGFKTF